MSDRPGEPDDARSIDGRLWDIASICRTNANQRQPDS
jgi:hypothetical protein